jgi:hypothetical protein
MSELRDKHNVLFFSAASMRELYDQISNWQKEHQKKILSFDIHRDQDEFCAIVATNPMEVIIVDGKGHGGVHTHTYNGYERLCVNN